MAVSYEKQTVANPNPIARFAHRERMKKSVGFVKPYLTGSATLSDYGCGPGLFLHNLAAEIKASQPDVKLLGYDPYMPAQYDDFEVVADSASIGDSSVSILTAFEVCEHLTAPETEEFIEFATRVLRPDGKLLISVPIEMGPILLLKEGSRAILHRRKPATPLAELLRAAFLGRPATRATDIKSSHRGYDWRVTAKRFSDSFRTERVEFSPLPIKKWFLQSQVFMLFGTPSTDNLPRSTADDEA
ncbi:class I SAM-dependent methyltransferase [Mycobacterium sp. JS623]|uniref:class I SAM-dependent methyltransferase n=1 Tax=Mycobacterium sp. JS623 TaxID=212767 RepID=UPI0002EF8519|nr:methyltransferase domain-containing protein [Mycobacterium sp. JS623]